METSQSLEWRWGASEGSGKRQWPSGNTAVAVTRTGRDMFKEAAANMVGSRGGTKHVLRSTVQGSKPKFRWRFDQSTQRWVCDKPRRTEDDGERWSQAAEDEMADRPCLPGLRRRHQVHGQLEQFCLSDSVLWASDDPTPKEATLHKHQDRVNA